MSLCLRVQPDLSSAPVAVRPLAGRFNHVTCAPSVALSPFVDHYWVSKWDRRGQPSKMAASLLDPCVHLQIQDGRAVLMGVVRGTYRVRIHGIGCIVGVKFKPGGFNAFVPQPASRWTNRTLPADELCGGVRGSVTSWAHDLSADIMTCDGDATAHASIVAPRLNAFLEEREPQRDPSAEEATALVQLIATRPEVRRVIDLVQASGRSERSLQRLFAHYVGVSPAWTIRRYRLKSAAERLASGRSDDVSGIAFELGYADQAHFIRDFRATIGVTPGSYLNSHA